MSTLTFFIQFSTVLLVSSFILSSCGLSFFAFHQQMPT
jgi:hypothetical protein